MAFEYFKYDTGYTNTLVARSNISFAPLVPPYKEIYYDILIPETQPLYLYRESGGTIIANSTTVVDEYLNATELPPTADGNVTYGEFTGTTAILSASTVNLEMNKVNVSGDTMTGSLSTTANFTAIGLVSGSSVCGGVWIHSPLICGSNCIQSALLCSTGQVKGTIITGSTSVCAPNIYATTAYEGGVTICSKYTTKSAFNAYTGTTVPNTYYNKTQINSYTGTTNTLIGTKLDKTTFNTFSGTTLPANYYNKTQINSYTGATNTLIGTKQNTITGAATSITTANLTLSRALVSDASGKVAVATTTATEIGYVNGVTSAIQTQINSTICTVTNLGTGEVIGSVSGRAIELKSIKPGSGIAMSSNANTITVCATGTLQPIMVSDKQILFASGSTITGNTNLMYCYSTQQFKTANAVFTGYVNITGNTQHAGTTRLVGAVTAASTLNVSGATKLSAVKQCEVVFGNPTTCALTGNTNLRFNGTALSVTGNINASTYVCSPIITGSTRVCSPIVCGTSCVTSPIVLGSTCICSPRICTSAVGACQIVFGNPTTSVLTGSTGIVYNPATCTLCTNYLQLTGQGSILYGERIANDTNGTTTCKKYLGVTGTSMAAGCYSVDFTGTFGTSGSNGETLVLFTCDNTIVGGKETYFRMSTAKAVQTASTFRNLTLSAGTHCFDIWYRSCSSTACAEYGAIRVRRIC
jgi:hypothetical protein